jgi:hypothetical protein
MPLPPRRTSAWPDSEALLENYCQATLVARRAPPHAPSEANAACVDAPRVSCKAQVVTRPNAACGAPRECLQANSLFCRNVLTARTYASLLCPQNMLSGKVQIE